MTSTGDDMIQELRASCTELVRRIARLPLSIIEGISRAIGHGAPRRGPQNLQSQQQPGLLMIPEEWLFVTLLEQQYGSTHPFFYACRFLEALRIAKDESKFVFLYLHAPDNPYTAPFCRDTLRSQLVVEFLDANFVSWGAVADRGEGSEMAVTLKAGSFPFCAVVAPTSGDSIAVLQQVVGPVSPEELVNILQKTIEEHGSAFRASRTEEEENRRANRQLRVEQDAAYLESLKKDKEKDRAQQRLADEMARAATERRKKANNERLQRNPPPKQLSSKTKDTSKEIQRKETVTSSKTKSTTKILIRFPNGQRIEQSFLCTDTIRSIFRYIDSLDIPGIGSYRLISNFPRKVYGYEQLEMTLKDAGLHPSATMFLELLQ
ncbi:plant UBX domain-containing protein 10-like [Phoenix dactylifera]|uniref:Plant UBX domain-containing protein 10-like n=1 Tax=Phoenix dactylifera TaxID=42345 RepID=A0A8B7D1L2_PHODC|nr:plant UBX domain-containing protein 10-like [Phoenix dactylifera]